MRPGTYRRDFTIRGYSNYDGEQKNPADKWQDAYSELTRSLNELKMSDGLHDEDILAINDALTVCDNYSEHFRLFAEGYKTKEEAFEVWKNVGWGFTDEIQKIKSSAALKNSAASHLQQLEEQVVQQFLLLRVKAVYLVSTNQDKEWKSFTDHFKGLYSNLRSWRDASENVELIRAADKLETLFQQYEEAGEKYYAAILQQRKAQKAIVK